MASRAPADSGEGTGERRWTALVLAAGRGRDDPMTRAFGVVHKSLLKVGGKTMLARVVEALLASPHIGEVAISIDDEAAGERALAEIEAGARDRVRILPAADSAAASVLAAVRDHGLRLPLLVVTGDLPLLTPGIVTHFLTAAARSPAALVVALARRRDVAAALPEMRRTWMSLGGEAVTSCNLFAIRRPEALAAVAFWRRAEKDRKRPWRLAMRFGPLTLVRLLLTRRGARHAVRLAGRGLGVATDAVFMPMPEAAVDVDKPDDLALARRLVEDTGARDGEETTPATGEEA